MNVPVMKGHQVRLGWSRRGGHGAGQAVPDLLLTSDTVQNLQGEPRCSGTDGTSSPSGCFTAGHLRKRTTARNHLSWFAGDLAGAQVKGEWTEWSKENFFSFDRDLEEGQLNQNKPAQAPSRISVIKSQSRFTEAVCCQSE